MTGDHKATRKVLRISDIVHQLAISRATIYRLAKDGEFPRPVKFGRSSVWMADEVELWVQRQVKVRNSKWE